MNQNNVIFFCSDMALGRLKTAGLLCAILFHKSRKTWAYPEKETTCIAMELSYGMNVEKPFERFLTHKQQLCLAESGSKPAVVLQNFITTIHRNQVCWSREISRICRTVGPEDQC